MRTWVLPELKKWDAFSSNGPWFLSLFQLATSFNGLLVALLLSEPLSGRQSDKVWWLANVKLINCRPRELHLQLYLFCRRRQDGCITARTRGISRTTRTTASRERRRVPCSYARRH
jgi:hypothetical protein